MATKTKPIPPRPAPRLYLATQPVNDVSAVVSVLPELLAAADIAADGTAGVLAVAHDKRLPGYWRDRSFK